MASEATAKSGSGKKLLMFGCLAPVVGLGLLLGLGALVRNLNGDLHDAAGLCGEDLADGTWARGEGAPRVVSFVKRRGEWDYNYNNDMPREIERADGLDDADLVLCLDEATVETVESCAFGPSPDKVVAVYTRKQETRPAWLIDPARRVVVARQTVRGGAPEACPAEVGGGGGGGVGIKVLGIPVASIGGQGEAVADKTLLGSPVGKRHVREAFAQLAR